MKYGIDIDGTITRFPVYFSEFTAGCVNQGVQVHIVTSRSPQGQKETVDELALLGIRYHHLHMLAPMSEAQKLCPHTDIDWYAKHCWLKVDYARCHSITHFVDDELRVLQVFKRFLPNVVAILPSDLVRSSGNWCRS